MGVAVVTGSAGLIGSEAARRFAARGLEIVGIDNDLRARFYGPDASTVPTRQAIERDLGRVYRHFDLDVRDRNGILRLFARYGPTIAVVVHAAAQPSHDWAAREPFTDFDVNAVGTLNVLEATRLHAPDAVFVHCSTNKVYGDRPNALPLVEHDTRYELDPAHPYADGIDEEMPIDACLHSLFGASKVASDVLVQEYGRYFGLRSACFRGGTLTGPHHAAAELHGFLAYLMRCTISGTPYTVYGYGGKQVRDVISSSDVVHAFERFVDAPRTGEVYNLGGGRTSNVSVLEAIALAEEIAGRELTRRYEAANRVGDHVWWISSTRRFEQHHPGWRVTEDVPQILRAIHDANAGAWTR